MTWQAVAHKDFRDAIRSKWLWALSVIFIGMFAAPAVIRFFLDGGGGSPQVANGVTQVFIYLIKEATAILVPLIAIVIAYAAIARERESGTLKLLLSLPHSRTDVVLGKVLGRSVVIAVPILVGFLIASFVLLVAGGSFAIGNYVLFALLTALLGVVFVGLSVGLSAAAGSNRQAMIGAVGLFMFATFFWNPIAKQVADLVRDALGLGTTGRYEVLLFLKLLNPIQAYKTLVDSLVMGSALAARKNMFGFFLFGDPNAAQALGDSLAMPFTDPFVVVYLLLWLFVPVALGALVFDRADL